jgi:dephospho-CoA kinase
MPAIGITGGIATGKTTFCRYLQELLPKAAFFDADKAARSLADGDPEVRHAIRQAFGATVYSTDGHLNRRLLRGIILQSRDQRLVLEQILHPRIRSQWSAEAQAHRHSSDFFFADIPLLYETGGEILCDRVVVVACSPEVQVRRLLNRDMHDPAVAGRHGTADPGSGAQQPYSPEVAEALELIKTQMPLERKMSLADHVVWNNDGEQVLRAQTADLVRLWQAYSWTIS